MRQDDSPTLMRNKYKRQFGKDLPEKGEYFALSNDLKCFSFIETYKKKTYNALYIQDYLGEENPGSLQIQHSKNITYMIGTPNKGTQDDIYTLLLIPYQDPIAYTPIYDASMPGILLQQDPRVSLKIGNTRQN